IMQASPKSTAGKPDALQNSCPLLIFPLELGGLNISHVARATNAGRSHSWATVTFLTLLSISTSMHQREASDRLEDSVNAHCHIFLDRPYRLGAGQKLTR